MRELESLVSVYQHDKHRPKEAEALLILRKIASLVKPIMRQRSWRVGTLCEFYPAQGNLLGLNINYGQKICLRLRSPRDERQFIPIEQVIDTMLHELCHIVHGPHNQHFHALWNQLRDEHEQLVRIGYTGEGFLSQGQRLGGKRIPIDEARRQARAAAEKRRVLTTGSGRKLGGTAHLRGTNMRKIIADAAERRQKVTEGCASGTEQGQKLADEASHNGFKTKAEEDDANERAIMEAYIELIQQEEREQYGLSYVPPSAANPAGPRSIGPPPVPERTKPEPTQAPEPEPEPEPEPVVSGDAIHEDTWFCLVCTLENPSMFLCCDACGIERPPSFRPSPAQKRPEPERPPSHKDRPFTSDKSTKTRKSAIDSLKDINERQAKKPLGWVCHKCGTFMESQWWTCSSCSTMKLAS